MRTFVTISVIAAVAALAGPAPAVGVPAPRGLDCGFASSNDPTGMRNADPTIHEGVITGGPFVVPDAASVELTCEIAVDGTVEVRRQASGVQFAVLAGDISYTAAAQDTVGICTYVRWAYADGRTGSYTTCP